MVNRNFVIILCLSLLYGCSSNRPQLTRHEVPVVYCPAPPVVSRPTLPVLEPEINQATEGEVAKKYKATVKALQGYAKELELQLEHYDKINKEYQSLKNKPVVK